MPEVSINYNIDPRTDWLIAKTFKELLEAIQLTGAGGESQHRAAYNQLIYATEGLQERPRTLGFWLKPWMDRWAAGELTTSDLGAMASLTRRLLGSNR